MSQRVPDSNTEGSGGTSSLYDYEKYRKTFEVGKYANTHKNTLVSIIIFIALFFNILTPVYSESFDNNEQSQISNDNWKRAFDQIIDLYKEILIPANNAEGTLESIKNEDNDEEIFVVSKVVILTSRGITETEVSKLIVSQINNMASPKLPMIVLGIGLDANMIGLENFASEPTDFVKTIGIISIKYYVRYMNYSH